MSGDKTRGVIATAITKAVSELVGMSTAWVEARQLDQRRLDWLDKNEHRVGDVQGRVNNEDGSVRDAIDWFMARDTASSDHD